jgi:holo-[acyl-carrier protein] synthase
MGKKMAVGIDVVEFEDVNRLICLENGLAKFFTVNEIALVADYNTKMKLRSLAGRFAVKEATSKALGTGFTGNIKAIDIETQKALSGKPTLHLYGHAKTVFDTLEYSSADVSISYSRNTATAIVVFS